MSQRASLDQLRDIILRNQQQGDSRPAPPEKQAVVTADGTITTGDKLRPEDRDRASVVPQHVFATSRAAQEAEIVRSRLPAGTSRIDHEGTCGWAYSVTPQFPAQDGTYPRFLFFTWHDGDYYQVVCLQPALEKEWKSPHTGHIYSDGRLCLGTGCNGGAPTLDEAFSRSVLWATGIMVARRTGQFPFSINNAAD